MANGPLDITFPPDGDPGGSSAEETAAATTGATTDAAVTTDANGTISGKLRGLVKIFASVWDSVNGLFNVSLKTLIKGEEAGNGGNGWMRANINNSARPILQASAAKTSTNNSNALNVADLKEAVVTLNVTAASGTTPTLDVKLQTSDDGGTTWYDIPSATFTQKTTVSSQAIQITNFGDTIRSVSTIAGTTPSFTYAIKVVGK